MAGSEPSRPPLREDDDTVVFGLVRRHPVRLRWLIAFVAIGLLVGALAGFVWFSVVKLPGYLVSPDGSAATTVEGLTQFFAGDAWFSVIGLLVGLGLGVLGWVWFGRSGWVSVPIVVLTAVAAAGVCWWVGWLLGPGPLNDRLVAARPGDVVPIELTVRAPVAVLVWVLGAIIPILARSSLGPDSEEPRPLIRRRRRSR